MHWAAFLAGPHTVLYYDRCGSAVLVISAIIPELLGEGDRTAG